MVKVVARLMRRAVCQVTNSLVWRKVERVLREAGVHEGREVSVKEPFSNGLMMLQGDPERPRK